MKTKTRSPLMWFIIIVGAVALIGFGFTPALADETGGDAYEIEDSTLDVDQSEALDASSELAEESFGRNGQATWVSAAEFDAVDSGTAYNRGSPGTGSFRCRGAAGWAWFDAPIRLPSGARVLTVRVYYDDNNASANLKFWIFRTLVTSEGAVNTPFGIVNITPTFPESPTGIARYRSNWLNTNIVIANRYNIYQGRANLGGTGVCITGLRLFWQRQIRTGLAHPFNDIGGLSLEFRNSIAALYQSGITTGTSSTTFSPYNAVTRGQFATFFARALGLHWAYTSGY